MLYVCVNDEMREAQTDEQKDDDETATEEEEEESPNPRAIDRRGR